MNRFCWWLVGRISRTLQLTEQDAVQGDFAELRLSGIQALCELLGFVMRRQVALWNDWRPWVSLLGIVGLVGVFLTRICFWMSGQIVGTLYMRWKYWTDYGNGLTIRQEVVVFGCQLLAVICWSWIAGFVLGSLSRGTLWINGFLFVSVWLLHAPARQILRLSSLDGRLLLFSIWPVFLFSFFLPCILGMRRGARVEPLGPRRALAWTAAAILLTALTTWTGGWRQSAFAVWSGGTWPLPLVSWQTRLLPYAVVSWPVGYLLAISFSRRERAIATR